MMAKIKLSQAMTTIKDKNNFTTSKAGMLAVEDVESVKGSLSARSSKVSSRSGLSGHKSR